MGAARGRRFQTYARGLLSQLANTNDEQFLNGWQGGSRSPSAIFQFGNRDVDIAIHPLIKV